jgi:hypothetical protein
VGGTRRRRFSGGPQPGPVSGTMQPAPTMGRFIRLHAIRASINRSGPLTLQLCSHAVRVFTTASGEDHPAQSVCAPRRSVGVSIASKLRFLDARRGGVC